MVDWRGLVWLIVIDSAAWAVLHMAVAWGGTQLPADWFASRFILFRAGRWEQGGRFYERVFKLRRWKHLLPDGAAWFSAGFPKARLQTRESDYLERFVKETCRGEAVHWVVLCCGALFFLWNPPWLAWCMVAYAITANFPCIVTQRYNRLRITRVLTRPRTASQKGRGPRP